MRPAASRYRWERWSAVHAQHLTVHQASWFNHNPGYSTVHLVNSLLVGVTNPGYYSGVSVGIESSGTGVFEAVGAGDHYLQLGSPHRNVGTSSIDTGLATRLKRLTTYAPVALTGPITQNTVLEPQAWRDIDGPDRGFHYEPADYAVNALQVQNATLTLTNGVVLATYGQNGLWLNSGAVLRSIGRPAERNYIVRFNTVMEQPLNWGGGGIDSHLAINPYHASGTAPVVECRFTDFALLAYAGSHLYTQSAGWVIGQLVLRDCGLRGGNVTLGGPGATAVELKNSLWQAVSASFFGAGSLQAHHNLFRRGYLVLDGSSGSWVMRDNVFDRCEIWDWLAVTHSHNAYVSTAGRIGVPQTGDQTLGSLTYYSRDLGRFYQHLASSLRNAGSRPVTAAGLAHYTTTSDYGKDTGQVDIGLHYVATTNGQPIDTDGDGLGDYVEDADGDGQVGATETDPSNVDTDGDELSDGAEVEVTGTDPLDPASKNHNQEYVRYSIAHPLWKSAQSSGTGVMTTEAKLLVARGVDALRLYVEVSTIEPASTRPTYNDHLTYLIQSPLIGIVGGTFNIAALGSQNPLVIFQPEWRVCHAKTLSADSYVTVRLTAQNVNSADHPSTIGVGLSALRVDFDPILGLAADDRLVFDNQYPTGVLSVPLGATVLPSEPAAFDYLTNRVRFEVDPVGDSVLGWAAGGAQGKGIFDVTGYCNTAGFTNLPTSNSAFGAKNARLLVEGLWGLDSQQQIRVFYPADAFNHPGGPPSYGNRPRNYFYYYMQTAAGIPPTVYGPFYDGDEDTWGQSRWEEQYPYRYYGAYHQTQRHPPGQYIDQPGVNGGTKLTYIDLFAWALRHEHSHHLNWMRFWAPDDVPMHGHWRDRDHHKHVQFLGDWLPDDQEGYMEAEGGPYSPTQTDSHPEDEYDRWFEFRDDHQRHNCNSVNAEEWPQQMRTQSHIWDWAKPGKNWPHP